MRFSVAPETLFFLGFRFLCARVLVPRFLVLGVRACVLVGSKGFWVFGFCACVLVGISSRFSVFARARVSRWVLVFGFRVRVLVAHYSDRCVVFAREFFGRLAPRGERVTSEC